MLKCTTQSPASNTASVAQYRSRFTRFPPKDRTRGEPTSPWIVTVTEVFTDSRDVREKMDLLVE